MTDRDGNLRKLMEKRWGRRVRLHPPMPQQHYEQTIDLRSEFKAGFRDGYEHQAAEITRLNERVRELEDALRGVVEIGHTASDSYFEKAKNITAGAYPAARQIARAALNTKDGRMANDMTRTRRKIREVAARLGVSELDVWYCSVDYQRAIKREQEAERLGMEKGA